MNPRPEPAREVPVDVLPPVPDDAPGTVPPSGRAAPGPARLPVFKTFYHPASGVVVLGLDWLLFGTDLATGFLALPELCLLGFLLTFALVLAIQRRGGRDRLGVAAGKALLGAVAVALPFPITGTILGATVLALSGLPHHPVDFVRKVVGPRPSPGR